MREETKNLNILLAALELVKNKKITIKELEPDWLVVKKKVDEAFNKLDIRYEE